MYFWTFLLHFQFNYLHFSPRYVKIKLLEKGGLKKMDYQRTKIKEDFKIDSLITVHYFEYTRYFAFKGESHDFWEFVYVDKGSVEILTREGSFPLYQGQMTFHYPNQWHSIRTADNATTNVIILSFDCRSKEMRFFRNRTLDTTNHIRLLLSKIIDEARNVYASPLGDPYLKKLVRKEEPLFGAEQLIKINLTEILIFLMRSTLSTPAPTSIAALNLNRQPKAVLDVISFMEENAHKKITFDDVMTHVSMSKTALKEMFRRETGMSVMQYFFQLKTERAKLLIRDNYYNITQISAMLGFESIHYFSRWFKKQTGMSPLEYARSVKAILEGKM